VSELASEPVSSAPARGAGRAQRGRAANRQDTEALRAEIAQTRAELGRTIQALAERADVKSRVQQSVRSAGRRPAPWLVIAAGAAAVVTVLLLVRGRKLGRRK
jgi:hypothetical protein